MKLNHLIKKFLIAFAIGIPVASFAQQEQALPQVYSFSAKEAADYALQNSIQVKNALLDIKAQEQVNKGITAAALPHLNASGSLSYNPNVAVQTIQDFISPAVYGVLTKNQVKDGNGQPITAPGNYDFFSIGFGSKYSLNGGVDFNQLLFDGQVFVGLQARRASIKNATLNAEVTQEKIKTNIYKIYYQLAVAKRQISTLDANISNYEKLLHDTREIYKNGFAEKLDVDKVQVQLNNLETQKLKAQNQIDAGKEGLKFLMNIPMRDSIVLTDTLSDEQIKSNILNQDFNYGDRKEYQQLESVITLGQYNIKRYKLSAFPTLSLAANYSKSAQRQEFDFFKGTYFTSSFIALRLNFPIFDGGARRANLEGAKITLQQFNNNLSQLQLSIDNDEAQARINMRSAILTMDAQKRNIELAQQVYNSTKLKYEQGLGSNQEISTAQTDLVTAQNNYYSSLYDAVIAKVDYLTATGKL